MLRPGGTTACLAAALAIGLTLFTCRKLDRGDSTASRQVFPYKMVEHTLEKTSAGRQHLTVFAPADYNQGQRRYPVVLLWGGLGSSYSGVEKGSRVWATDYRLDRVLSALADGTLTADELPFDSAGPGSEQTAGHLERFNRYLEKHPCRGLILVGLHPPNRFFEPGQKSAYETFLLEELRPFILQNFGAARDRWAADGFSLGGLLAYNFALKYSDRFDAAGALQGALHPHRIASIIDNRTGRLALRMTTTPADPWKGEMQQVRQLLQKDGHIPDWEELPGRHNDTFLQSWGGLSIVLFHERALNYQAETAHYQQDSNRQMNSGSQL